MSEHENDVLEAISIDPNWDMFTNDSAVDNFRRSLKKSVAYVCYSDNEFCGYVRALLDEGFAVYVSELYVVKKWRNRKIGQSMLDRIKTDYSDLTVYALSDEDVYYQKKGYKKIGSVFEIELTG